MRKLMIAAAIAASTAVTATPAMSQVNLSQGLVNVTITDVSILNNFLNDTQIAALNNVSVPITVQVPIGIAANVCNLSVAALGQSGPAGGKCEARSGSRALAQVVNRQVLEQKK